MYVRFFFALYVCLFFSVCHMQVREKERDREKDSEREGVRLILSVTIYMSIASPLFLVAHQGEQMREG